MNDGDDKLVVDVNALFRAHGIHIAQQGERHYRALWIHTKCPFCSGNKGNHLGFSPQANVFTCHRCGRHGKFKVIAALLNVSTRDAGEICKRFGRSLLLSPIPVKIKKPHTSRDEFKLPGNTKLLPLYADYLASRGFDPDRLFSTWNLRCSGNSGRYKYRIVCPITHHGLTVSFTARDVTGKQQERYLSAYPEDEVRSAKRCLYGESFAEWNTVIVVEGPADAWRIGHGAVATLGTKWTPTQAKLIARWKRSFILYDPGERDAQDRAERLCHEVSLYTGHKSRVLEVSETGGRDPGEFTADEVKEIRKILR